MLRSSRSHSAYLDGSLNCGVGCGQAIVEHHQVEQFMNEPAQVLAFLIGGEVLCPAGSAGGV